MLKTAHKQVVQLLKFIDASPSPYHAVEQIEKKLLAHDFKPLSESIPWMLEKNKGYYVVRDQSSIIAFRTGHQPLSESGYKIIGAHTDSPSLKITPNAAHNEKGYLRLGVEIYGAPILATFSDRDLSLAGRVSYKNKQGQIKTKLVHFKQPLLRLPNLAIHLNRQVNEQGLKFQKQTELPLIFACTNAQLPSERFFQRLEHATKLQRKQILSWELTVYDTQKGAFWGEDQAFYANSQLDNLVSCHAALKALLHKKNRQPASTHVCAFFDHEEVGSESYKGADGNFLNAVLKRISANVNQTPEDYQRSLSHSLMISVDMAQAYHPNFPTAYELNHHVMMNKGLVIKINANQRYSSDNIAEARFIQSCQQANVPYQHYSHCSDIPCGSTIGPMSAANLGIRTVDIGSPMWAMHSIRESAGVLDHYYMIKALQAFLKV
ncbi:MAG: M18 family aminopeptidase [Methylococcales bacterium]|nr:M18 family aminopeptidase [Methylococcales bacterium]